MREQVVDVPPQEVITRDNVVVTVDAVVYYQATDPVKLKYNVANFIMAATKLAQTNLRNVVGDMDLDDALTSRDTINTALRNILDEATDVWVREWFETLGTVANGQATKIFLPLEASGALASLGALGEVFNTNNGH